MNDDAKYMRYLGYSEQCITCPYLSECYDSVFEECTKGWVDSLREERHAEDYDEE